MLDISYICQFYNSFGQVVLISKTTQNPCHLVQFNALSLVWISSFACTKYFILDRIEVIDQHCTVQQNTCRRSPGEGRTGI